MPLPAALAALAPALLIGFTLIALGYFVPLFSNWVAAIHEFHFLGGVFLFLIVFMTLYSRVSPSEVSWTQTDVGAVDLTPWPHAKNVGMVLVVLVFAVYAAFADFSVL